MNERRYTFEDKHGSIARIDAYTVEHMQMPGTTDSETVSESRFYVNGEEQTT